MTTITLPRAVVEQALEALESCQDGDYTTGDVRQSFDEQAVNAAIVALWAALAEPVQEPVAWAVYDIKHGGSKTLHWPEQHSPNGDPEQYKAVPLYSAPPQRTPLTDEKVCDL